MPYGMLPVGFARNLPPQFVLQNRFHWWRHKLDLNQNTWFFKFKICLFSHMQQFRRSFSKTEWIFLKFQNCYVFKRYCSVCAEIEKFYHKKLRYIPQSLTLTLTQMSISAQAKLHFYSQKYLSLCPHVDMQVKTWPFASYR